MPLEALGKDEKLNIRKIEAPEQDQPSLRELFDFQAENTPGLREELLQWVKGEASFSNQEYNAVQLLKLFPDMRTRLDEFLGSGEGYRATIEGAREHAEEEETGFIDFMTEAENALVAHPELSRQELGILDSDWDLIKEKIGVRAGASNVPNIIDQAMVIFPEHTLELLRHAGKYDELRDEIIYDPELTETMIDYAQNMAQLRVLFPNRFTTEVIADLLWPEMKDILQEFKDERKFSHYINLLLAMRTLSADRLKNTGHGIKFEDTDPNFGKKPVPLPETKK